ncbi:MAG: hypothetical protein C0467_24690 [Planctomycetaceae bacterium]|nr:hypothetical protein [Planctomycetaceae bacterium]
MTKEEAEAATEYVQLMLRDTLRLVNVGGDRIQETASGILIKLDKRYFLLSAGHALKSGSWVIETNKTFYPAKVVVLGIPAPHVFHSLTEDFAWSEFDFHSLIQKMQADPKFDANWIDVPTYIGPFPVEPDPKMPFGFASWKATEFLPGINTLVREPHFEVGMKFDGIDKANGLYRFLPARKHQGHDYYRGCSGAPITDASRRLVSLVACGIKERDDEVIWGTPLANYADQIGR